MACAEWRERGAAALAAVVVLALAAGHARPADGASILAVQMIAGKSHWNFMSAVLMSLTDAGHRVTVFTPFPEGDRENYTEVDTSGRFTVIVERDLADFGTTVVTTDDLPGKHRMYCDSVLGDGRLDETVRKSGFDVVLVEPLVVDCMSYLAHATHSPVVYVVPSAMLSVLERPSTGHGSNPACVSHMFAAHTVPETFGQRFANAALYAQHALRAAYGVRAGRLADPRPYDSSTAVHPSVVFQNSHYITESPRPVTPNVVHVGGIHLSPRPARSIPKDILDFIEDSPHGVIFFTFGSTVKLSSIPKHTEKAFKEVLSKFPQRVLMKYETKMDDMPKNVMVKKWFPQREILLHPKVKLFISHGGISGVYETVDAGVPVLGFPLFYDQKRNLEHLVRAGMAITMDLLNVSEDVLYNAISELINNEKYMKNAKIASNIFKDRPLSPAQSVVYWTEYVIRHKGAPHLKSHAFNLTWYQYFLLDVIGAALIVILTVLFITYKVFRCIYFYIFKSTNNYKVKTR